MANALMADSCRRKFLNPVTNHVYDACLACAPWPCTSNLPAGCLPAAAAVLQNCVLLVVSLLMNLLSEMHQYWYICTAASLYMLLPWVLVLLQFVGSILAEEALPVAVDLAVFLIQGLSHGHGPVIVSMGTLARTQRICQVC